MKIATTATFTSNFNIVYNLTKANGIVTDQFGNIWEVRNHDGLPFQKQPALYASHINYCMGFFFKLGLNNPELKKLFS